MKSIVILDLRRVFLSSAAIHLFIVATAGGCRRLDAGRGALRDVLQYGELRHGDARRADAVSSRCICLRLAAVLLSVVALFLRASLTETSSAETRSRKEASSLREIFKHHSRAFLIVLGFTAGGSLIFYTFTTYMQKYLVNTAHMNDRTANVVMTAVLCTYMVLQPPFGAFSDRFGRKTSMLLFGGLARKHTVPLMYAIGDVQNPYVAYVLIVLALSGSCRSTPRSAAL